MTRPVSKRVPTSLKAAFELDKAEGIRRGLSVERHAELHAVSASRLYKWMEDADLPANRLAAWFHNTHGRAVIRYLAAQAGGAVCAGAHWPQAQPGGDDRAAAAAG